MEHNPPGQPASPSPYPPRQPFQPHLPDDPPPSPYKERYRREGIKSILTTILILLIAPILALTITAFVFQSYEVDGPSMEPTLKTHDRLIIWKAGRSWSRLSRSEYIPERGSIVVFVKHDMYDTISRKDKQLIKRLIGLPGDRVVVKDGKITVYNDENPNGFDPDSTLGYGPVKTPTEGNVDITVDQGEVFVVGDNRPNSLDSRNFGTVPVKDIVGTLSARILPLSQAQKF